MKGVLPNPLYGLGMCHGSSGPLRSGNSERQAKTTLASRAQPNGPVPPEPRCERSFSDDVRAEGVGPWPSREVGKTFLITTRT